MVRVGSGSVIMPAFSTNVATYSSDRQNTGARLVVKTAFISLSEGKEGE